MIAPQNRWTSKSKHNLFIERLSFDGHGLFTTDGQTTEFDFSTMIHDLECNGDQVTLVSVACLIKTHPHAKGAITGHYTKLHNVENR